MRQYQTVIVRLQHRTRDDEVALTDLLNERARMGWEFCTLERLDATKLLIVFRRDS